NISALLEGPGFAARVCGLELAAADDGRARIRDGRASVVTKGVHHRQSVVDVVEAPRVSRLVDQRRRPAVDPGAPPTVEKGEGDLVGERVAAVAGGSDAQDLLVISVAAVHDHRVVLISRRAPRSDAHAVALE